MSANNTYKLVTQDGCLILLHYYKPAASGMLKAPILLVHGFAANAHMWDSPVQEGSIASYFSRRGFPVFAIDLRYRVGKPCRDWNLDDYVLFDIPCVQSHIESLTGHTQFHWIGHSMGGLLGYMYQALHGSGRVLSQSNLGSPGFQGVNTQGHIFFASKALSRVMSLVLETGRLDLLPPKIMATLVAASFMVSNPRKTGLDKGSFDELQTKNILGNVSRGEVRQLTSVVNKGGLFSPKYRFHYMRRLSRVQAPLLVIAGDRDLICPPKLVLQGFKDAPARYKDFKLLGKKNLCRSYYGHLDLIMGASAKKEVWPHLLNWIERFDSYKESFLHAPASCSYSIGQEWM